MKKYSDYFSGLSKLPKVGNRIAMTALVMLFAVTMSYAQDFIFIEGSTHSFSVQDHPGNTFEWTFRDVNFDLQPLNTFEFIEGQFDDSVTIRFEDMGRTVGEMVFLAVTESAPSGCSTTRAIQILLENNNMYLEFASAETQDCFSMGDYLAPLKVGINFMDDTAPIPSNHFPLNVTYKIRNVTDGLADVVGNAGEPLVLQYSDLNEYFLLVTEAVGELTRTIEYELTITEVTDKFNTPITQNADDIRLQIRIINHLPQSGTMDMAMAFVITPIRYTGEI